MHQVFEQRYGMSLESFCSQKPLRQAKENHLRDLIYAQLFAQLTHVPVVVICPAEDPGQTYMMLPQDESPQDASSRSSSSSSSSSSGGDKTPKVAHVVMWRGGEWRCLKKCGLFAPEVVNGSHTQPREVRKTAHMVHLKANIKEDYETVRSFFGNLVER
jgi:hypothetical protein